MVQTRQPKIGLLGLMLELYDKSNPELRPDREKFAKRVVDVLGEAGEVIFPGIKNTREGVAEAVDRFIAEDVDIVITVHFSYSPSLISLRELMRYPGPLVLWNTQELKAVTASFQSADMTRNHGMHGVQDLANTLNRVGRSFGVVTGHYQDEFTLSELADWARAACTAKVLGKARLGQVGFVFQDMGDFGVDETTFMGIVGPHVVKVNLGLIADALQAAPEEELRAIVAADRETFDIDEGLTEEEHLQSARTEWAFRKTLQDLHLDAVSVHYEALAADPRFGALPFAAASKLIGEGYGFGGEGDIISAACVVAMKHLCGISTFGEMFTMDFEGDAIYMAHYAEANPQMAAKCRKIRMVRREGWVGSGGVSTSLAYAMEPGPVTLTNLTIGPEGMPRLICAQGCIEDFFLPQIDTPHCKFSPDGELWAFLDGYALAGGSHHLAMSPGNHLGRVEKLAEILGLPFIEL